MAEQPKTTSPTPSSPAEESSPKKTRAAETPLKALSESLSYLQSRAEKFEDAALASSPGDAQPFLDHAQQYRDEAKMVRAEIILLNRAASAELARPR